MNLDPIDIRLKGVLGGPGTQDDALTQALALADELIKVDAKSGRTAKAMLERLEAFGRSHYEFFSNGFRQQGSAHLEKSDVFPPEAVCSKIVFQIQEDLEIILRAIQQRLVSYDPVPPLEPAKRVYPFLEKLQEADQLVYWILNRWQVSLGQSPENYGVLTYFQKSNEIRTIPYAPVALVGIPFSALSQPRDLLAIPHEVGHYVFGHRPLNPETDPMNRDYFVGERKYAAWQEEIYADVFGALFGGAIMAFDFQELSKQSYRDIFISRGDEHPDPYLRPLIYTEALRMRGNAVEKKIADLLDKRWTDTLLERWSAETDIEGQPDLEAFKTEIQRRAQKITARRDEQKRNEFLITSLDIAFQDLAFENGRVALGAKPLQVVKEALTLLSGRGNWSGPVQEFEDDLKNGKEDLDAWFQIAINRKDVRLEPVESSAALDLTDLWDTWVNAEQLLGGATVNALNRQDETALQIGVGKDEPDFFTKPANPPLGADQEFSPTWQGIWFAGQWATDPSGIPSGGQP